MTDPRTSYLNTLGIHPNSIPGRACIRGDWDQAQGMIDHRARIEAERLRNRLEADHG